MKRKFSRKYSLSVVVPFIGILIVSVAFVALVQTPVAGQQSAQDAVAPAQPDTGAAALQRPLLPGAPNAGPPTVVRPHKNKLGASPMEGSPIFGPATLYDSGGANYEASTNAVLAVADVNSDGHPDLVVANECQSESNCNNGNVSVLLGNGDGTFQPAVAYDSGGTATAAAVADVNGDGKPDLVVANLQGMVAVLLGNGDGTFQSPVTYSTGGYWAVGIAIGDVNGDGKPDVVVANWADNTVGVLLGNGNGTFQPAVNYGSGGTGPNWIVIGDLNGDGKPDLAVANGDSGAMAVGVLLGNGDGTFQPAVTYNSGGTCCSASLAVADLNGDGKPDIVAANWYGEANGDGTVGVLLGNGDGTFQPAVAYDSGGSRANSLAVADVNGDGKLDVEVVNSWAPATANISVLLGNGDGTFQPFQTYGSGATTVNSIIVADVNHDGEPDLVVANQTGGNNGDASAGVLLHTRTRRATTLTRVTTSGSPSLIGQPVTFTATVTSRKGTIPDGELVTFYDGKTVLGSVALVSEQASYTTSTLKAGKHVIKATYPGDAIHKPSSGMVTQVVNKYPTTTTLRSSLNPSQFGQAVTFTAQVTSSGPMPTGKVRFFDAGLWFGSATLSGGAAKLTWSRLLVGKHAITAEYSGDAANAKSTSPVLHQVVQ